MAFEKEAAKLYSKLIEDIPLIRLCEYSIWTSEGKNPDEFKWNPIYNKKRRVYPPFHKDGSIWWKQFLIGNWRSLILVLFIVLITLGVIFEYTTNLRAGAECIARETIKLLPSNLSWRG